MEVEQISTSIELLTNADAYQTLQDLTAIAGEILEQVQSENQLTDVQMQNAIEQFGKPEEVLKEVSAENTDVQNFIVENDDAENAEAIDGKQHADGEADVTNTTDEVDLVKETTTLNGKENEAGSKGNEQNANHNQQVVAESNFQLNNTQTVNQSTIDFNQNITDGNLSTQEIYDQIGEYIKTNIKPGISEVEMQLNPENLGTLHIHLSSKQGNVTAQLTVQNELVKAALEVQLIQLKENFAEQGIKVDAVEVTVESHAFNQNMQHSNEENAQAQTEAKRSSTRSINLNGDWTEEELTEEEQLVAEMMEADGNTVDFKA
jgi:flagellar hook-length control protein FliK